MQKTRLMGPRIFQCLKCNDKILCKPDGQLKFCKEKCVGIDHTSFYTRFLGNGVALKIYDEDNFLIEKYPNCTFDYISGENFKK